jgi:hypothetical protein
MKNRPTVHVYWQTEALLRVVSVTEKRIGQSNAQRAVSVLTKNSLNIARKVLQLLQQLSCSPALLYTAYLVGQSALSAVG